MKLATAFVEVRPDLKGFRGELERETTRDVTDVSRRLGQALAGGLFLAGAKKATDAASSLEQAVGGTSAVFGQSADAVEDWARRADEAAGLSERAARELTSQIGGLLKGFGFTNNEAADLSITLAQLGADLAATFGGTPEDAVIALGAALRGETDPLERYGIALNQTLVNQKAVELGLAATTSAVDQHAKAQATLALITERSADAQGQFAREADSAAGQAAISAAKAENAAADMGENLLPIYTRLTEVVGAAADVFGALPEPVQTAVIALGAVVALSGPVRLAGEAIASLATIARTVLVKSLDTAAVGAYNLAGNLGKATLGVGALGLAVTGAALIFQHYQDEKAKAAEIEKSYTDILSEQSDAVEENTAAFAGKEILDGKLGETLRDASVNVKVLTDAVREDSEALTHLNDEAVNPLTNKAADLGHALEEAGLGGTALADELLRLEGTGKLSGDQMVELTNRLNEQAEGYIAGEREAENKAEADEQAGVAADKAAPKVENLADKLDINEQAAKDAAESVDLFREAVERALAPLDFQGAVDARTKALSDIAAGIDERAQAVKDARQQIADLQAIPGEDRPDDFARQMADAQAALREALDQTSLTLEGNSDAALRNRDELRGLIDDSVGVIESARDQGRSLGDLTLIRQGEIDMLRTQLEQMGFNEEQIETYIDAIEDIPLTRATTITADTRKAELQIESWLERMQREIDLNPLSVDVLQAEKFTGAPRSVRGFAAGGDVGDGLFRVHDGELMRKDGERLEVLAGAPTPIMGGGSEALLLAIQEQNSLLAQIAGNTAGPTTSTRLRRTQAMAGVG